MNNPFDRLKHRKSSPLAAPKAERRRAPRWKVHVPVFVYGRNRADQPFHEDAYSAVVSDCGALLIMTTAMQIGDTLLLTNKSTEAEQECRVVNVGPPEDLSIAIAVEFTQDAPSFWRVTASPQSASALASIEPRQQTL